MTASIGTTRSTDHATSGRAAARPSALSGCQYLAKRWSQLVTGLADQVRGQARRDATRPVWAPPGSRPNLAIIGEVAVWRAANGIHPSDPRPTGAAQLQTASALWQHHLDRSLARGSDDKIGHLDIQERPSAGISGDRRHQDRQRLPQPPAIGPNPRRRAGPRSPAKARVWSQQIRDDQETAPGGHQLPNPARLGQGAARARRGRRRVSSSVRALRRPSVDGRRHAGAPSGGCSSTRGLYSTSWMRPSKVRCSIISRATSG